MTPQKQPDGPIVLMIDNETLSLRPDAYITQVGYVVGNVVTGEVIEGPYNVNLMNAVPTHAHIDIKTVAWWMQQSDEARKGVFAPGTHPQQPRELFEEFAAIVRHYGDSMPVYASPAMFDLPQLTLAWGGRKPWGFSMERDMMTLYKLLDPLGKLAPPPPVDRHVAGTDALWQFHYLVILHERLGTALGSVLAP